MSVVFPDYIGYEVTGMGAYLCDESGAPLTDESGSPITLEQPGWVDVTADVMDAEFTWGSTNHDPLSRVAGVSGGRLRLNNSHANAHQTQSWYTPSHANAWSGFGEKSLARMHVIYGAVERYYGLSEIVSVRPAPGKYDRRSVEVTLESVVRWYAEDGNIGLNELAEGLSASELYQSLTDGLVRQPPNVEFIGGKVLAYGFDTATRAKANALNELNKITQSTLDYVLVRSDADWGATVFRQGFNQRIEQQDVNFDLTLITNMSDPVWDSGDVLDVVLGTYYPRRIGEELEVLWNVSKPIQVRPGETVRVTASYRDPNQSSVRIAGKDIELAPEAGLDLRFGITPEDSSNELINSLMLTVTAGVTEAELAYTNHHPTLTGYVNRHNLKGYAIRFFETGKVAAPREREGGVQLQIDMPYEDNNLRAKDIADVLYELGKEGHLQIDSVTFNANRSDEHMLAALLVEPGQRIRVFEEVTVDAEYFVNGKNLRQIAPGILECTLYIELAPPWEDFWLCGVSGRSECGETTVVRGV